MSAHGQHFGSDVHNSCVRLVTAKLLMRHVFVRLCHIACISNRGNVELDQVSSLIIDEGYERRYYEGDPSSHPFSTDCRELI